MRKVQTTLALSLCHGFGHTQKKNFLGLSSQFLNEFAMSLPKMAYSSSTSSVDDVWARSLSAFAPVYKKGLSPDFSSFYLSLQHSVSVVVRPSQDFSPLFIWACNTLNTVSVGVTRSSSTTWWSWSSSTLVIVLCLWSQVFQHTQTCIIDFILIWNQQQWSIVDKSM